MQVAVEVLMTVAGANNYIGLQKVGLQSWSFRDESVSTELMHGTIASRIVEASS